MHKTLTRRTKEERERKLINNFWKIFI